MRLLLQMPFSCKVFYNIFPMKFCILYKYCLLPQFRKVNYNTHFKEFYVIFHCQRKENISPNRSDVLYISANLDHYSTKLSCKNTYRLIWTIILQSFHVKILRHTTKKYGRTYLLDKVHTILIPECLHNPLWVPTNIHHCFRHIH